MKMRRMRMLKMSRRDEDDAGDDEDEDDGDLRVMAHCVMREPGEELGLAAPAQCPA